MSFLITGYGSIGKRHFDNLYSLTTEKIFVHDANPAFATTLKKDSRVIAVSSRQEALSQGVKAVLICTPADDHMAAFLEATQHGCAVFLEKPICTSLSQLKEFEDLVKNYKHPVLVGQNLRFHDSFLRIRQIIQNKELGDVLNANFRFGQYLPDWHPNKDYQGRYHVDEKRGGGILLDGIQEIDCSVWFFGRPKSLVCFSKRWPHLKMNSENMVSLQVEFESGQTAQVHLDYCQRAYERNCRVIGTEGTLFWDFNQKKVSFYSAKTGQWTYHAEALSFAHCYKNEMAHFLKIVKQPNTNRVVPLTHAMMSQKLALLARASSKQGKVISFEDKGLL